MPGGHTHCMAEPGVAAEEQTRSMHEHYQRGPYWDPKLAVRESGSAFRAHKGLVRCCSRIELTAPEDGQANRNQF
jgi:hypothetical protein